VKKSRKKPTLQQQLRAVKRDLRDQTKAYHEQILRRIQIEQQLSDLGAAIAAILPKVDS
jgi:hypothetical protein